MLCKYFCCYRSFQDNLTYNIYIRAGFISERYNFSVFVSIMTSLFSALFIINQEYNHSLVSLLHILSYRKQKNAFMQLLYGELKRRNVECKLTCK